MITKYRIEYWNPLTNRYRIGWEGTDFKMADLNMFKPYNRIHTRRLIKLTEEIMYTEKGDARNKVQSKTNRPRATIQSNSKKTS